MDDRRKDEDLYVIVNKAIRLSRISHFQAATFLKRHGISFNTAYRIFFMPTFRRKRQQLAKRINK